MKLQNKLNFFLFFISIISLSIFKNVNASLQDQYRSQKCTFNNASFQHSDIESLRYCINKNNGRVTFVRDDGEFGFEQGYVGRKEAYMNMYGSIVIYEWAINSNELVQYQCYSDDYSSCYSTVEINKKAFRR